MSKIIIGIMGPGEGATEIDIENARQLGLKIAQNGWTVLTGGRSSGVMHAAMRGAKAGNGLTIGVLPGQNKNGMSPYVDIPVITGMGEARNAINILSSDAVVACGIGLGTTSEISLALKNRKPVILYETGKLSEDFFSSFDRKPHIADASNIIPTLEKMLGNK